MSSRANAKRRRKAAEAPKADVPPRLPPNPSANGNRRWMRQPRGRSGCRKSALSETEAEELANLFAAADEEDKAR